MSARTWIAVGACGATLLAGCGDDEGDDGPPAAGTKTETTPATRARPEPSEPLTAATRRLERAVDSGSCRRLARILLHSVARGGGSPNRPPTRRECAGIDYQARGDLKGFEAKEVRELGPAGFVEGSGDNARSGQVVGVMWGLDRDGSWKVISEAIYRTQIGVPSNPRLEANARAFVTAVATKDCDGFWRLLNVGSRFVRGAGGKKRTFCREIAKAYEAKDNGIADLARDPDARPEKLGTFRDVGLFGLPLESGRYLVIAMSGRLGGIADAEQRQHHDPSAIELVTVRPPGG